MTGHSNSNEKAGAFVLMKALGVLAGASLGARLLGRLSNRHVRRIFVPVLVAIGIETILRGFGVGL